LAAQPAQFTISVRRTTDLPPFVKISAADVQSRGASNAVNVNPDGRRSHFRGRPGLERPTEGRIDRINRIDEKKH